MVDFPTQRAKDKQTNLDVLDNAVVSGDLDFLHNSKNSVPSMKQSAHGSCNVASANKM